jgi:hypothetical protein
VKQLSHLPLAIVQAAAYINENSISPAAYIELLNEADATKVELLSENFEDDCHYPSASHPVATTWLR